MNFVETGIFIVSIVFIAALLTAVIVYLQDLRRRKKIEKLIQQRKLKEQEKPKDEDKQ